MGQGITARRTRSTGISAPMTRGEIGSNSPFSKVVCVREIGSHKKTSRHNSETAQLKSENAAMKAPTRAVRCQEEVH